REGRGRLRRRAGAVPPRGRPGRARRSGTGDLVPADGRPAPPAQPHPPRHIGPPRRGPAPDPGHPGRRRQARLRRRSSRLLGPGRPRGQRGLHHHLAGPRPPRHDADLRRPVVGWRSTATNEAARAMNKGAAGNTTSLNGYVTGPDNGPGKGLGEGGERLHWWVFGGPWTYEEGARGEPTGVDKQVLDEAFGSEKSRLGK